MHEELAPPTTRARVAVGIALGAAALATILLGRLPFSIFVAVVCVLAYNDLRRSLAEPGHLLTFLLGGIGVLVSLWAGYSDDLELLPGAAAGLVIALLVTRIVLYEANVASARITDDIAATLGAAATVGVLGAHVLLIRSVDRTGFRALLAFGLMVVLNDAVAFLFGRAKGRRKLGGGAAPNKTWEGVVAGFVASVGVGLVAGLVLDPPFDVVRGLAFGAGMGVLAPLGDLAFAALKRSAGSKGSAHYLGPLGGALDAVGSVLFCAPAFYWALRTIAL